MREVRRCHVNFHTCFDQLRSLLLAIAGAAPQGSTEMATKQTIWGIHQTTERLQSVIQQKIKAMQAIEYRCCRCHTDFRAHGCHVPAKHGGTQTDGSRASGNKASETCDQSWCNQRAGAVAKLTAAISVKE